MAEIENIYSCMDCPETFLNAKDWEVHKEKTKHTSYTRRGVQMGPSKEAIRVERDVRYDILIPEFLECMAKIAHYGAIKYGDFNWQISRLTGNKGPINHMYKHLNSLRTNEPYDHSELGTERKWHLAAIAFNAMMEFYWENKNDKNDKRPSAV